MKKMTLQEVIESTRPVWLEHRNNPRMSGWVLYHSEQRPYIKFNTFGGCRVMLNAERYGAEWCCYKDQILKEETKNV